MEEVQEGYGGVEVNGSVKVEVGYNMEDTTEEDINMENNLESIKEEA